jgi:RNA polymerase sigma-70 factor (ECF subfamily)
MIASAIRFMDQDRQKQTFLESFDLYHEAIYRFCVIKTSDTELARDFTQETFCRYWQALRSEREMENTRAFLYTIAQHLIIDWYRKKKSVSLDALADLHFEPKDAHAVNAEEEAQYGEVRSAIGRLNHDHQSVLILRYVEGLGPKDIAEILGVSPNVVSVRIDRALKKVRQLLHTDGSSGPKEAL